MVGLEIPAAEFAPEAPEAPFSDKRLQELVEGAREGALFLTREEVKALGLVTETGGQLSPSAEVGNLFENYIAGKIRSSQLALSNRELAYLKGANPSVFNTLKKYPKNSFFDVGAKTGALSDKEKQVLIDAAHSALREYYKSHKRDPTARLSQSQDNINTKGLLGFTTGELKHLNQEKYSALRRQLSRLGEQQWLFSEIPERQITPLATTLKKELREYYLGLQTKLLNKGAPYYFRAETAPLLVNFIKSLAAKTTWLSRMGYSGLISTLTEASISQFKTALLGGKIDKASTLVPTLKELLLAKKIWDALSGEKPIVLRHKEAVQLGFVVNSGAPQAPTWALNPPFKQNLQAFYFPGDEAALKKFKYVYARITELQNTVLKNVRKKDDQPLTLTLTVGELRFLGKSNQAIETLAQKNNLARYSPNQKFSLSFEKANEFELLEQKGDEMRVKSSIVTALLVRFIPTKKEEYAYIRFRRGLERIEVLEKAAEKPRGVFVLKPEEMSHLTPYPLL